MNWQTSPNAFMCRATSWLLVSFALIVALAWAPARAGASSPTSATYVAVPTSDVTSVVSLVQPSARQLGLMRAAYVYDMGVGTRVVPGGESAAFWTSVGHGPTLVGDAAADDAATRPAVLTSTPSATSDVLLNSSKQLQSKFKHASDFGVTGNYSKANAAKFSAALNQHINSSSVTKIAGTYRGNPVTHYLDRSTGLNVIVDPSGTFVSGWKLGPEQLMNVLKHGGLS